MCLAKEVSPEAEKTLGLDEKCDPYLEAGYADDITHCGHLLLLH